jgi:hypothetical protein
LATFRLGPALWIVFGAAVPLDVAALRAQAPDIVRSVERIPNDAATILRLVTAGGFNPSPRRAGTGWIIELRQQLLQPDTPVGVSIQAAAQPPRIMLGVPGPGTPVAFRDPELGESLTVVPVNQVGLGVVRELELVDTTILLPAQGIALRPISDGVTATALPHGVAVTAAGGLVLSSDGDRALRGGATPHRLFNFKEWYGPPDGDVLARRRALEQNIVAAAPVSRSSARLDLAHFYLAHALGPEAVGVLAAIQRDDPNFAADPRVRAVDGAALLLDGRLDEAAPELDLPALDGEPEIEVWRGALAAARHDFKAAADEFAKGGAVLRFYPPVLRHRFALAAAKAALAEGQQDQARDYLALVKDHPDAHEAAETKLLTARVFQLAGDSDAARAILDKLAEGDDRETRARARLTRTLEDLDAGKIKRPAAIQRLDALRFAWRGDDVELTVLRRLGELQIKDGAYRAGFASLHRALENFPDYPQHHAIAQELAGDFADIFIGPDAENVPPLKALALYSEFKQQLMPSGAKGDEIIRHLADRLVSMDLLDQAAELLDNQVRNRLTGRDKARVAARLAVVRLLDRKPQQALEALDIDVGSDIGADLQRQRRQLRARALSELGRSDEALKVLAGDESRDADRLRADIAWRTRNWPEAAKILERLAVAPGADGKLSAEDARIVLDWATALTLAGDQAGVARLATTYAKAMDASPFREPFRVVAGDPGKEKGDMRQLVGEVAQLNDLQSFMADYRKKLSKTSLSAIN